MRLGFASGPWIKASEFPCMPMEPALFVGFSFLFFFFFLLFRLLFSCGVPVLRALGYKKKGVD